MQTFRENRPDRAAIMTFTIAPGYSDRDLVAPVVAVVGGLAIATAVLSMKSSVPMTRSPDGLDQLNPVTEQRWLQIGPGDALAGLDAADDLPRPGVWFIS
jgi:hypothetical protein